MNKIRIQAFVGRHFILVFMSAIILSMILINGFYLIRGNLSNSYAEDNESVTTRSGLYFDVPEDWPVVKRKGLIAPVSLEEFTHKRFNDIESKIDSINTDMEQRLSSVASDMNSVEKNILDKFDEVITGVASISESVKELAIGFDGLKADYVASNKDIKNELNDYSSQIQALNNQISNIEQSLYLINNELAAIKRDKKTEQLKGIK